MNRFFVPSLLVLACSSAGLGQEPGAFLESQFERLDKDGDGRLSKAEAGERPFFVRADADNDGYVTREEARKRVAEVVQERRAGDRSGLPEGVRKSADVPYSKAETKQPGLLTLDVYQPEGAKDLPVMVYVHGGGWTRGDKRAVGEKMPFFCSHGYVFVSVNYRLLPKVQVPDQAGDVATAVAWVHGHARQYGGDPNRLFLMGHSAGAHLVSLVATDDGLLSKCGKNLSVIKGVIELDTAGLDVPKAVRSGRGLYAKVFGTDPESLKRVSPLHHVAPNKQIPPFLFVVAGGNKAKLEQSRAMAARLREVGTRAEVVEAPDKNHGTLNQDLGKAGDEVTRKVMGFVEGL